MTTSTISHKVKSLAKPGQTQRSRKSTFLKWLRDIHGWIGLWGAVLGLLFGVTGILQNHRAVLKVELAKPAVSDIQMTVPQAAKHNPQAMGAWLRQALSMDREARIKKDNAVVVSWNGQDVQQPEHWDIRFVAPQYRVVADYWVGNDQVTIKRTDETLISTLNNFHRASGAGVAWVLLADTIGGSMILLSLTGVLLWTELHKRKTLGVLIFVISLAALAAIAAKTVFG